MFKLGKIFSIAFFVFSITYITASAAGLDPRVVESRAVIKEFGSQLIGQLKQAIEKDGPVNAIKVCNVAAPDIAAKLSDKYNWRVGRTSLKTRNPNNRPDAWELEVLQQFEQRKQKGEGIATLEYHEDTEQGFRYMKAIPTKGLCLSCHGANLTEPVKVALEQHYPEDKATGFESGDIRGAFTIIQQQ
jgi:Protein of unknown function (DUF3365)